MYRIWIGFAGFFGFTAVLMAALASHLLVGRLDPASLAIVKSGIDIACWDILGRATGLPVCVLMGGRFGERVRLFRALRQRTDSLNRLQNAYFSGLFG